MLEDTINSTLDRKEPSCALIDVDDTLLYRTKESGRTQIINYDLIERLKLSGIKDIYLFTNMDLQEINSVNPKIGMEGQSKRITREDVISILKSHGFTVHGVITQADVAYNQGLGSAYNDFYLDAYKEKMVDSECDIIPRNKAYLQLADQIEMPSNMSDKEKPAYQKKAMFEYFLKNAAFKRVLYIDDDKDCLDKVKDSISTSVNDIVLTEIQINKYEHNLDKKNENVQIGIDKFILPDKIRELKQVITSYENILKSTSTCASTSIFMRNKNFTKDQLKAVAKCQNEFKSIIKSINKSERASNTEIKSLADRSNNLTPHLLDFQCTRFRLFAVGQTSVRKKINKLLNANEGRFEKFARSIKNKSG